MRRLPGTLLMLLVIGANLTEVFPGNPQFVPHAVGTFGYESVRDGRTGVTNHRPYFFVDLDAPVSTGCSANASRVFVRVMPSITSGEASSTYTRLLLSELDDLYTMALSALVGGRTLSGSWYCDENGYATIPVTFGAGYDRPYYLQEK